MTDTIKTKTNEVKLFSHSSPEYVMKWNRLGFNRYNGAYYYSQEIVNNIIPHIDTDRPFVTVNIPGMGFDRAVVFVHNNLRPERYAWLKDYKDIIFVCGLESTKEKMSELGFGTAIYLPLSVDVEYVSRFKADKTRQVCFAGRPGKKSMGRIPAGTISLEGMPRDSFLTSIAMYEKVYAVGRAAIEAKILGAEILPYDERFPDPEVWKVLDNHDAALMLQDKLNEIDGKTNCIQSKKEVQGEVRAQSMPSMSWKKQDLIRYARRHGLGTERQLKSKTKDEILQAINKEN